MKTHLFILTFFFTIFYSDTFGQKSKVDSILTLLQKDKSDSNQVYHLVYLSDEYKKIGEYDSGLQYCKTALLLAKKIHFPKGIAMSHNNIGIIYYNQGNYDKALENYLTSLKLVPTDDKNNIQWKKITANAYNNIGIIYRNQGANDKALENYFASLKIREEIRDNRNIAASYHNIGVIYSNQDKTDLALLNLFKALKINKVMENKNWQANNNIVIGRCYFRQGNDDKALNFYFEALKIYKEIGAKEGIALSYINISDIYLKQNKITEAKKLSLISLSISKEVGSKEDIKAAYFSLSHCDSVQRNWNSAYEYYKLYKQFNDSIFNEDNSKKIAEMNARYDSEKKQDQIKLLEKDKEKQEAIAASDAKKHKIILTSVISILLFVVIFAIVSYRQKNIIKKEKKRSDELLLNILPSKTAEELKLTGHAEPKQFDMVTVLFTDFKGFTTIAEKMTAKELVAELHYCFEHFDKIIAKYPIEKIKTIGDAYMCAGGLPASNATNPLDIVNAALDIQRFMLDYKEQRTSEGKIPFEIRIGIHTGTIVAGIVGIKKFAYDIWGDTVNTASRMESSGEAGKVNISGDTHKLLQTNFNAQISNLTFTSRGMIKAKNKGEIEMYFVERTNVTGII